MLTSVDVNDFVVLPSFWSKRLWFNNSCLEQIYLKLKALSSAVYWTVCGFGRFGPVLVRLLTVLCCSLNRGVISKTSLEWNSSSPSAVTLHLLHSDVLVASWQGRVRGGRNIRVCLIFSSVSCRGNRDKPRFLLTTELFLQAPLSLSGGGFHGGGALQTKCFCCVSGWGG